MQRRTRVTLAVAPTLAATAALAQGDLSGVTMRVLDDVGDVDAIVLALDANRGEGEEAGEREGRDAAENRDAREPAAETAEDRRRDSRQDRDELHGLDVDERSEGRLEDRDVERRVDPPPAP